MQKYVYINTREMTRVRPRKTCKLLTQEKIIIIIVIFD
jgi:hypothetical protein